MIGYFNSKPLAKINVIFDSDAQPEGNAVADHIEEHLLELGYSVEMATEHVDDMPLYIEVQSGVDYTVCSTIHRVMIQADAGKIDDVFSMDNPDNAAYSDYCSWTSVKEARVDAMERELAFLRTV